MSDTYRDMLLTARMQANLAAALYQGRREAMEVAYEAGGLLYWVEVAYARAAALVFDDHAHIVVCGTNDTHDWIQNLSARLVPWDGGLKSHEGFARTALMVYRAFDKRKVLEHLAGREIVLGGHSAGGAIAQLLSMYPSMRPREMVTFGAPRVFCPESASQYQAAPWEVRRFVCSGDPVPGLPLRKFWCLFDGAAYGHDSPALHLGDDGKVLMDQSAGVVRKGVNLAASAYLFGVTSLAEAVGRMPSMLGKHSMQRYYAGIEKAIEVEAKRQKAIERVGV